MKSNESSPEAATDKPKLAAIPAEYQPRFETDGARQTFLDEKELLRRLPISRRTLWNWRHQKKIPSIAIGRRVLYCWDSVAEALRRLERGGSQ
jgi:predicted DNA-binding transcriptional regulator AlpA